MIVFRDLRLEETMNLEVVSLASILFSLYALVMAIAHACWCIVQGEARVTGSWLWPDSRKADAYKRLASDQRCAAIVLLLVTLPKLPGGSCNSALCNRCNPG